MVLLYMFFKGNTLMLSENLPQKEIADKTTLIKFSFKNLDGCRFLRTVH